MPPDPPPTAVRRADSTEPDSVAADALSPANITPASITPARITPVHVTPANMPRATVAPSRGPTRTALPERNPEEGVQRVNEPAVPKPSLRIGVHDRSRLEWVATVPVAPSGEEHLWTVEFEAEIPDAMWLQHGPWDHFTVRSRLTSPSLTPGRRLLGPAIDQLRRRAMSAAHDLKGATVELVRPLRELRRRGEPLAEATARQMAAGLWQAVLDAWLARDHFGRGHDSNDVALERERRLAEEFVSNQILMLITEVTRAFGSRGPARSGKVAGIRGETEPLRKVLAEVMTAETEWRRNAGVRWPTVRDTHDIEGFVHRAALLKKHFQQALFLDARAYMLDQRLRNWIAMIVAMIASTFYFVWQVWVLNSAMSAATTTNSLIIAGLIAGIIYAGKDRIKEVGREWVTRRVRMQYGDRIAHLRLQERMDPKRSDFGLARETIVVNRRNQADALNPALGATQVMHHLHIVERLRHTGLPVLHQQGLLGLKHVFRYDLSPLLVKLDDQLKRVPIVSDGDVRILAATRVYMVAVRVRMQRAGSDDVIEQDGVLRMRRSGLERFVPVVHGKGRARRRASSPHFPAVPAASAEDQTPLPVVHLAPAK